MSRWTIRRQGEVLGYLALHPDSTVEDIAEQYKRHPDQVRETLNQLEAAGDVASTLTQLPGLLEPFPALIWTLTGRSVYR
jgi:predicted ArsR family transcriptional regulator